MAKIDYTKREQITKTFSLELKPVGETRNTIAKQRCIEKAERINELRAIIYKAYNSAIKLAIDETLNSSREFDSWKDLYQKFIENRKDYINTVEASIGILRENIKNTIEEIAGVKFGSTAYVNVYLRSYIPNAEDLTEDEKNEIMSAIEEIGTESSFIYKRMAETREATITSAAKRVYENLEIYFSNMKIFEKFFSSEDSKQFCRDFEEAQSYTSIEYYGCCLRQCDIEAYNLAISGEYDKDGNLVKKGYNATSNEFNIKNKQIKNYKGPRYGKAKSLKKQMLFPYTKHFSIEKIETDDDVRVLTREVTEFANEERLGAIIALIRNASADTVGIMWNKIGSLSHIVCGDAHKIGNIIKEAKISELEKAQKEATTKTAKGRIEKQINNIDKIVNKGYTFEEIATYCDEPSILKIYARHLLELRDNIVSAQNDLNKYEIFREGSAIRSNAEKVKALNSYYSAFTNFYQALKIPASGNYAEEPDTVFYNDFDSATKGLFEIIKNHDKVRNYCTQTPGDIASQKKLELKFRKEVCWTKGDGEDKPEREISILEKNGIYYLATRYIGSKGFKFSYVDNNVETYNILCQSKGQKAQQFIIGKIFNQDVKNFFENNDAPYFVLDGEKLKNSINITREEYEFYTSKVTSIANLRKEKISKEDFRYVTNTMINFYKQFLENYKGYEKYNIVTRPAEEYECLDDFFSDIDLQKFILEWKSVDSQSIDKAVADGKLLLFKITNREMYKNRNKYHTYAKQFLSYVSEENLKNNSMQLNGSISFFYRPAIIPRKVTHKKGSILINIKDRYGVKIPEDVRTELYKYYNGMLAGERLSDEAKLYKNTAVHYKALWDIVKDEAFTREVFSATFNYTLNRDVTTKRNTICEEVSEKINDGTNIITVYRGFSHLVYIRITEPGGKSIHEEYLDSFDGTDYREFLLKETFKRKEEAANEWKYAYNIKNTRTGYIDKAISRIIELAIEYDAVILVEKINDKFKDKAQAFDNQVFKTFEKRLSERLLAHIDVNSSVGEISPGSVLNPMQLTHQGITSKFPDARLNGILYKMPGAFVNQICPYSGFVNLFNFYNYNSLAQKRNFLSRFKRIYFNSETEGFNFIFSYDDFATQYILPKSEWSIDCSLPIQQYSSEKKKYVTVKNPSIEVIDEFISKGYGYENVDIVELIDTELPGSLVEKLFKIFKATICRKVIKDDEGEYYLSPAINTEPLRKTREEINAINLLMKFNFHASSSNDEEDEYINNWFKYVYENRLSINI